MSAEPRLIEVRKNILKRNDLLARDLRERFREADVFVASFVSSPGSGKTAFLEKTLTRLRPNFRCAALVGDLATANDAARLARAEVPVKQIVTGTICHLEAQMVSTALEDWDLNELDCLFIENVGNLVCPSSYDLGEALRVVLMSTTEGEDKPLKYPTIFNTADVAVITKMDLAEAVEFDLQAAHKSIQAVRPAMRVFEVSSKTGAGMDEWLEFLTGAQAASLPRIERSENGKRGGLNNKLAGLKRGASVLASLYSDGRLVACAPVRCRKMLTRTQIQIKGIVQGVGFRPFVFALAEKAALKGRVLNNHIGVLVDVEGEECQIEKFISELEKNPPPLSLIESIEFSNYEKAINYSDFRIVESNSNGAKFMPISADIATCDDCLREMFDENNRRFRYPFINCTNCGPRFTIIENVPYDRAQTTMRDFEMCEDCRIEYENPLDRRFHAEPTCCTICGPKVFLTLSKFEPQRRWRDAEENKDAFEQSRQLLLNGKILAVKGIGGFHLVCDALNAEAVKNLRARKYREDKPFALMANSIEVIEKYCFVSEAESGLLLSKERPIVLLERKSDALIPKGIAPKAKNLGFMLPYTPLHYLLLENLQTPLVMTSGNVSDEPICYEDAEVRERLKNIADFYLLHNRRIHIRTDDSVVRVVSVKGRWGEREKGRKGEREKGRKGEREKGRNSRFVNSNLKSDNQDNQQKTISLSPHLPFSPSPFLPISLSQILRRSRGYAPAPIKTSFKFEKQILACGAELKNTFCLTRDNYAFVSHHIGDLENLETLRSFTTGIEHFKRLFNLKPEIVAYDLHPEYLSTKYALEIDATKIGVQHHHAHIASCLADNEIEGEVIGVAFDGIGFGTDGKLWGGEFFVADFLEAERFRHLEYMPMPGGAKAIREPWRMAAVYLQKAFGDDFLNLEIPFVKNLNKGAWKTIRQMITTETNCPETSSMGRLFDGVASLLGVRDAVNYEGQAAIELEAIAEKNCAEGYVFEIAEDESMIKISGVINQIVKDMLAGVSPQIISAKFHNGTAQLISFVARQIRNERKLNRVALSGGVFQNMLLLEQTCRILKSDGFDVFTHSRVPTNDGGISLGQAAIANAKIVLGRI